MSKNNPTKQIEQVVMATNNKLGSDNIVQTYQATQATNGPVEVDPNFKAPKELLKAQSLANLLDTAVKIPLINFRVGLDFLVGLVPGIGDIVMLFASMRIVHLGHKMGVPKALRFKMLKNAVLDYGLGFVPIIGDIVDMFYKANQRNVRLLEAWWVSENKAQIDALTKHQLDTWQNEQEKL